MCVCVCVCNVYVLILIFPSFQFTFLSQSSVDLIVHDIAILYKVCTSKISDATDLLNHNMLTHFHVITKSF